MKFGQAHRLEAVCDNRRQLRSASFDLKRIEIKGGAGYIERVYFEITESNIEQWNKPHIKVCYFFKQLKNISLSLFIFSQVINIDSNLFK